MDYYWNWAIAIHRGISNNGYQIQFDPLVHSLLADRIDWVYLWNYCGKEEKESGIAGGLIVVFNSLNQNHSVIGTKGIAFYQTTGIYCHHKAPAKLLKYLDYEF